MHTLQGRHPAAIATRIEGLHAQVPQWGVGNEALRIERTFRFRNFREALTFVQQVGELAEAEGHHPDISFGWGYVTGDLANGKAQRLARERLHCGR